MSKDDIFLQINSINYKEKLGNLENIDWDYISIFQTLSKDFIRELIKDKDFVNLF